MGRPRNEVPGLAPRELAVAELWDQGLSHAEIARQLKQPEHKVDFIVARVVDNRDPVGYKEKLQAQSAALLEQLRRVHPQYCSGGVRRCSHAA